MEVESKVMTTEQLKEEITSLNCEIITLTALVPSDADDSLLSQSRKSRIFSGFHILHFALLLWKAAVVN